MKPFPAVSGPTFLNRGWSAVENAVSVQTIEFLYSALLGIGIGVLYDIIRLIRFYMSDSRVVVALFDVLFWVSATISLLVFVLTVSDGRMRWYVLFGAFAGGFVYMASASEIFFSVLKGLIDILKTILKLSTRPVYFFLRSIKKGMKKVEISILESNRKRTEKKKERIRAYGNNKKKKKEKRNIA